jgi:hypothetical protein
MEVFGQCPTPTALSPRNRPGKLGREGWVGTAVGLGEYEKEKTPFLIGIRSLGRAARFGQVHCPSSGVSQHCIHAVDISHASYVGVC